MHEHNDCQHELKYCDHCDVVYCKKCKHEWGKKETVYVPYYYTWGVCQANTTTPYVTYTTTGYAIHAH